LQLGRSKGIILPMRAGIVAVVIVVPALSGWPAVGDWVRVTRKMVVGGHYARLGLAPDDRVSTFAVDERP